MPHTFTHAAAAATVTTATTAARRRRGGVPARCPFKATRHQTNWHLASLNLNMLSRIKMRALGEIMGWGSEICICT